MIIPVIAAGRGVGAGHLARAARRGGQGLSGPVSGSARGHHHRLRHHRRALPDLAGPGRLRRHEPRPRLLGRLSDPAHQRPPPGGHGFCFTIDAAPTCASRPSAPWPRCSGPGARSCSRTWAACGAGWSATASCGGSAREGRGPPSHRRGGQRRLGPVRQGAASRCGSCWSTWNPRRSSTWSTSALTDALTPPRRPGLLRQRAATRPERRRNWPPRATRPTPPRPAGSATTTRSCGGAAARPRRRLHPPQAQSGQEPG